MTYRYKKAPVNKSILNVIKYTDFKNKQGVRFSSYFTVSVYSRSNYLLVSNYISFLTKGKICLDRDTSWNALKYNKTLSRERRYYGI